MKNYGRCWICGKESCRILLCKKPVCPRCFYVFKNVADTCLGFMKADGIKHECDDCVKIPFRRC